MQTYYNINNFTFISGLNYQFPPFKYNYILLNKETDYLKVQYNNICQIVNQEQECISEHDVTHSLLLYNEKLNKKFKNVYLIIDSVKFKLKRENNLEDKPLCEDKGLINVYNYKTLLKRQFKREGLNKLPISFKKSGNYIIQKLAQEYKKFFSTRIKYLADLFNFHELYPESVAWDILIYFSKKINSLDYQEVINNHLRNYLESDITKVCDQFYDALKSKNFDTKKIINWRCSKFQKK